jgi:hypothetical protein
LRWPFKGRHEQTEELTPELNCRKLQGYTTTLSRIRLILEKIKIEKRLSDHESTKLICQIFSVNQSKHNKNSQKISDVSSTVSALPLNETTGWTE